MAGSILIPNWVKKYVGIPYVDKGRDEEGVDCYGLVRMVYADTFNISLPSLSDTYDSAKDASQTLKDNGLMNDRWVSIKDAIEGAVVLLKITGNGKHVGIMISPTHMLHSLKGHNSAIEPVYGLKWQHRVEGFYVYI